MLDIEIDWNEGVSSTLLSEQECCIPPEPTLTYRQQSQVSYRIKACDAGAKKVNKKNLAAENFRLQRALLESEVEVLKSENTIRLAEI